MNIKYCKIRNVKDPEVAYNSSGIDLFIPKLTKKFIGELEEVNNKNNDYFKVYNNRIYIEPHSKILIPSGIKVKIPINTSLIVHNKSGVSTKKGLDKLAEVIDADYQGEIHISLYNTTREFVCVDSEEKIIQLLLIPTIPPKLFVANENDLYNGKITIRGKGAFGSSGSSSNKGDKS